MTTNTPSGIPPNPNDREATNWQLKQNWDEQRAHNRFVNEHSDAVEGNPHGDGLFGFIGSIFGWLRQTRGWPLAMKLLKWAVILFILSAVFAGIYEGITE